MRRQQLSNLAGLALLGLLVLFPPEVKATEKYAAATGAECGFCHLDPLGGGTLTESGRGYRLSVQPAALHPSPSPGAFARIVKLLIGYLHILTAFMWFGTILYVHLVLKPAYASQGLPRGEVKVGLASMVIMAVTGATLTGYKVSSLSYLVTSTFGILLLAKITLFSSMVLSALYVVLVIGPKLRRKSAAPPPPSGEFSPAALAGFDGGEGRPAYLAYKGKVYDVGQSKLWKNGSHMRRHQAGVDLTEILSQAPHGEDKIMAMPEVGRLTTQETAPPIETHTRVFYFMAYMNLGFVFLISLILALWRWY